MIKKLGVMLGLWAGFSGSLFGVDAYWTATNSYDYGFYWLTKSNWSVDGATPALPPTNATDTVYLGHANRKRRQAIYCGTGSGTGHAVGFEIGAIYGDNTFDVTLGGSGWSNGSASDPNKVVKVLNPNNFYGFFDTPNANFTFEFPSTAEFTPVVANYNISSRPNLCASGTGKVQVKSFFNLGAITKTGAAELQMGASSGAGNLIYVREGNVAIDGKTESETLQSVLDRAYLHLDASDASTFEYVDGSTTSVTNWLDVRKNGQYAWVPNDWQYYGTGRVLYPHAPFVSTEKSPTGLKYLDFGSCFVPGKEPLFGPTNCCMAFKRISNGSEFFYVVKYHEPIDKNAVIGDNDYAPMQPWSGAIFGGSAHEALSAGYSFMNGKLFQPTKGATLTNDTFVLSFGSATNVYCSTIAVDQMFAERCGGMMIGEIVIFTNQLTQAERLRVHEHLRRKWVVGGDDLPVQDWGMVYMENADSQLKVEANQTVKVLDVVATNGTLIKTGAGTLQIDTLYPEGATLNVRGGAVKLNRALAPSLTVADDPLVRLDASAAGTVVTTYNETYETNFVTEWKDCRSGVEVSAVPFSKQTEPHRPTVKSEVSPTGLDVVDFGSTGTSLAAMTLPWYGKEKVKAGFIVMRQTNSGYSYVPFFGCHDMSMDREASWGGSHSRILGPYYSAPGAQSAIWTINGVPVDPITYMPQYFGGSAPFIVVAFNAHQAIGIGAIALGRGETGRAGGIQVGEYILYDRELTDQERRNTEAYLMNKWLGTTHPAAASKVAYSVAADQPTIIDNATNLTVTAVAGGNGNYVKRGVGQATLAAALPNPSTVSSVAIESGELVVPVDSFLNEALYHFDASDYDSYETNEQGQVSLWNDTRANGIFATNSLKTTVSTVLKQVETTNGVTRPMMYFQDRNNGSSMFMSQNFRTLREEYTFSKGSASTGFMPFCFSKNNPWDPTTDNYLDYYRVGDTILDPNNCAATLKNGLIWINGESKVYSDTVDHKSAILWGFSHTANTRVNALTLERGTPNGGYIGEQIAFSRQLTTDERTYLQRHLLYKWLGLGSDMVWTNAAIGTVSVAAGAKLTLTGAADPMVDELTGAGSIVAKHVQNVQALNADAAEVAEGDYLKVSGKVSFADAVTVTLDGQGRVFTTNGAYPILEAAGGLENANVGSWTLDVDELTSSRKYSLGVQGNQVVLNVEPNGIILIIK